MENKSSGEGDQDNDRIVEDTDYSDWDSNSEDESDETEEEVDYEQQGG